LKAIQSTSIERFEDLKTSIKLRLPSQYPGENLEQLAAQFRKDALELTTAGQYDHNLTLSMMKIFLLAGGSGNEDFRFPLRATKQKLEQALLDIGFKEKTAANDHMSSLRLTYKDICTQAEDTYRTLFDRKEWPPARHARDSKAPPPAFGHLAVEVNAPITRAEVLTLMQNKPRVGGSPTKKPGNCNKCGKPGHWANECPDKQQSSNPRSQRNQSNRQAHVSASRKPGWRSTPPAAGAPTTKKTDTHTFNWCASCKRWTTTHSTETHTGVSRNTVSNGTPAASSTAMFSLVQDPSVWITETQRMPDLSDLFYAFSILPFFFKVVFLLAMLPLVGPIVWFVDTFVVPILLPIWRFDYAIVLRTLSTSILPFVDRFPSFVADNYTAFIAPFFWVAVTSYSWRQLRTVSQPNLEGPAVHAMSRTEYRRYRQELLRNRRRPRVVRQSIKTEGLHRQYPLNLRSMGHYVRKHQAPTVEEQRLRDEIRKIQIRVQALEREVSLLSKLNYYDPTLESPWQRQQQVPDVRREGGNPVRYGQSGNRVRPNLHPNSPTVNRAAGRPFYGQQTRRSPAPVVPDRPASHQPHTVDANDAYYRPTDPEYDRNSVDAHMARMGAPTLLERVALLAPSRFRAAMSPESTFSVIWDSGASVTISPEKLDFVGPLSRPSTITQLNGIAKGLRIEGEGKVHWSFHDSTGKLRTLELPAYYVPKIRVRLLSTTSLLQTYSDETIKVEAHRLTMSGVPDDPNRSPIVAHVNPDNNLPTSQAYRQPAILPAAECLNATISAVNEANLNLSEPEKELLRWHYRLGHISFRKIQFLMRSGVLTKSNNKRKLHQAACSLTDLPKCAACQYGKQHRRPAPGRVSTAVRDREGVLKDGHLVPGQQVSVDHFVSSTKGRLFTSAGRSLNSELYSGGCLFNDHASGFVHIEFQTHLNTHETLMAKENFELMCRDHGVIPQSYLSDNAKCFTTKAFTERLSLFEQIVRFAGVGAHHHNGNAERSIQTIMSIARTMMLHSAIHWPDVADASLWPMAVQHAVFLHNHMPNQVSGLSPVDVFTKSRWQQHKFHDLHVWGCPVYVLDKSIADGKKLPRWKPRSTRCVNMGLSSKHASTVPIVLNPSTGYITPQFHIVFDDWFSTITSSLESLPDFNSRAWAQLFGESYFQYPFDDEDETEMSINDDPTSDAIVANTLRNMDSIATAMDTSSPPTPFPVSPPPTTQFPTTPSLLDSSTPPRPISSTRETVHQQHDVVDNSIVAPTSTPVATVDSIVRAPTIPITPQHLPFSDLETPRAPTPLPTPPRPPSPSPTRMSPMRETTSTNDTSTAKEPLSAPARSSAPSPAPVVRHSPRRSTRQRNAPSRLGYDGNQGAGYFVEPSAWIFQECGFLGPPLALKASLSDPDTLTYDEAMSDEPNLSKWMAAAAKEIASLEKNKTWIETEISNAKSRILPGTWVFKRKRTPDGVISKYKARYCVRGDLEEGEPETFAPVVAWSSVRLFTILALTLNWDTSSIDFSNAFVQAKLETPVWIHLPRGFQSPRGKSTCLQLVKSLYGLSVAPRLWFEHVLEAFTDQGFKQSTLDPCFLFKDTIMVVLYVDDVGIAYANESDLNKLLDSLEQRGLQFTKEGTFTDFLGIKFVKDATNNTVTLTQKGLIQRIIDATGMSDCNPNWTPAIQLPLGIDPDGEPYNESWSYPSIVGMLLYLSTNTRPDIAFAVSQVARFNHSPKKSHATAIKTIIRYLHRTADKGTIVRPTGDLSIDCYVDADFAGLHGRDPDYEPSSAKSRTGYIITLGGCPILWKSKLQTEISLSTLESEYSALSASMRTLIPLRSLLSEVVAALRLPPQFKSTIRCRVFEDNNGALLLATKQRITNRTKYFLVKWHFFWSHVTNGDVSILKVDTKEQWADYLTKGLNRETFEHIRKLVQGW
jgi:hypothetical protein